MNGLQRLVRVDDIDDVREAIDRAAAILQFIAWHESCPKLEGVAIEGAVHLLEFASAAARDLVVEASS